MAKFRAMVQSWSLNVLVKQEKKEKGASTCWQLCYIAIRKFDNGKSSLVKWREHTLKWDFTSLIFVAFVDFSGLRREIDEHVDFFGIAKIIVDFDKIPTGRMEEMVARIFIFPWLRLTTVHRTYVATFLFRIRYLFRAFLFNYICLMISPITFPCL